MIDPHFLIFRGNIGCDIAAFSPKMVPMMYYAVYLYQILLRLDCSFKGSYLSLNRLTFAVLASLVFVPLLIFVAFCISIYHDHSGCLKQWDPLDFSFSDEFSFCNLPILDVPGAVLLLWFGILWVLITNIVLAVMFGVKLKKLLSNNGQDEDSQFKVLFFNESVNIYTQKIELSVYTIVAQR